MAIGEVGDKTGGDRPREHCIRKKNIYRSKHLVNLNPNTDVLSTSVSFIRDGPFNFQEGGGGYGFFF